MRVALQSGAIARLEAKIGTLQIGSELSRGTAEQAMPISVNLVLKGRLETASIQTKLRSPYSPLGILRQASPLGRSSDA